jgi:2-polyprenyl-6-hydroxyphenyl methylase / 3-demethylubiquinone-9 3-methyltransferase
MTDTEQNIDRNEIQKFDDVAANWWDKTGDFKPLHAINPLRLEFINQQQTIADKTILDVGCGGGILSESMAELGAKVTGIDMSEKALNVAKSHLQEGELAIDYQQSTAEDFAKTHIEEFDIVTCLEMLEHVPDPASVINACTKMVKPGGGLFFSTINRNIKAYLFAILGAEYILQLLPKGTHDYAKFIRPSELARWTRDADLTTKKITGMSYNPLTKVYSLTRDVNVNYLVYCQRRQND